LSDDRLTEVVNAARLATLGTLVAGVAHELNTPLGAINSNHDVLRRALGRLQNILADDVVDETELAEVRRIVRALDDIMVVNDLAVDRLNQLVSSLRSFGRPDRAERDFVDIHEGIESAIAILGHELKGRIEVVRDYGDLPVIECFPNELNQVFMNLLVNASQAIADRGTITVRTRGAENGIAVEIEDDGNGIAPENLDRIFEPGFTTRGSRIGMGMGLAIARQIVDRHTGRITVRSTPGVGTAFTVWLPVRLG